MSTVSDPPSSSDGATRLAGPKPVLGAVYPGLGRRLIGEVELAKGPLRDDKGRPLVFSAREISPREDNPLWLHERLGEFVFWKTLPNGGRLPRNVRHSVMLFYLLGRGRGRWWDAFLMPLLPLVVVGGLDVYLVVWSMRGGWLPSVGEILVLALSSPLLMAFYAQWMTHRTWQRAESKIRIESLAVTRIRPADIVYALAAWPALHLHLANAMILFASGIGLAVLARQALAAAPNARAVDEVIFVVGATLLVHLLRWMLFTMGINIGVATTVRNRLMIRSEGEAIQRSCVELAVSTGLFLSLTLLMPIILTVSTFYMSLLGPVLLGPPLLFLWTSLFLAASTRAAYILNGVVSNWRSWWMCTGLERPLDKNVLSDDW